MSLTPQDLVWVHGKSTCWRHPEEIAELLMLISDGRSLEKGLNGTRRNDASKRVLSTVYLPDHNLIDDYERWPPTLSIHFNSRLADGQWWEAGSDMDFEDPLLIAYPVIINGFSDDRHARVTVRLIEEPGYSGRGRRTKKDKTVRLTPVFERSDRDSSPTAMESLNDSRRIAIEFLADDEAVS